MDFIITETEKDTDDGKRLVIEIKKTKNKEKATDAAAVEKIISEIKETADNK